MYIRLYSKYSLLVLWLWIATAIHAQQFGTVANPSVGGETPAFANPMLQPKGVTPMDIPHVQGKGKSTPFNGQVFGKTLFTDKYKHSGNGGGGMSAGGGSDFTSGASNGGMKNGNFKTISSISSYQNIGSINAPKGGTGAPLLGAGTPPPPPPTPGPGPDGPGHQLPLGDALWFLVLLSCGYGLLTLIRRKA